MSESGSTKTLCPYCGVGCGLEVVPSQKNTGDTSSASRWQVRGDRAHPSSQGMVCVKGATVLESLDKDRLLYPMVRDRLNEPFRQVSWEEALTRVCDRIQAVVTEFGPDALCMYGSGQFQTEEYYVAQKLMKGCLGTNNFDANSRLCMSSAVSGYVQSFGSDGPPCCYEDLDLTDCAFLIGTNTAECHPIVFNRLRKHHKKNAHVKLVVIDPRRTTTAEAADLHLAIRPGTDIDLLNGIAYLLWQWGCLDQEFIDQHTSGFDDFLTVIRYYTPDVVADRCQITAPEVETAARYWRDSQRVLSMWSMGINQSSEGTAKVRSIINLHLMTGMIGKPGAGPFSLTGQPNAMGGREAGGLSHLLPGYRSVLNPQHRAEVELAWQLPPDRIQPVPGRTAWDMITGLETGAVQFFWIAATNPAVSMPDLERTKAALARSPFTVYQDCYYPTETSTYAHVLLPASQWGEETGVMTNSERRVTLCQQFRQPPGESRPDWEIFAAVGRRLGFAAQFAFQTSADVFTEFVQLTRGRTCDMTGMSHARLAVEGPLHWPLPAVGNGVWGMECGDGEAALGTEPDQPESPARINYSQEHETVNPLPDPTPHSPPPTPRLYIDRHFPTPDGRARFGAYHSRGLAEPPDDDYPFVLTTGRLYGHWHTQTRTGRIPKTSEMYDSPFIEIHPRDAAKLGIEPGAMVAVRSRRGVAQFPATITTAIAPGTVFVPMHWGALWADQAEANALTHAAACPDSKQPELKACAVQLMPLKAAVTGSDAARELSQISGTF